MVIRLLVANYYSIYGAEGCRLGGTPLLVVMFYDSLESDFGAEVGVHVVGVVGKDVVLDGGSEADELVDAVLDTEEDVLVAIDGAPVVGKAGEDTVVVQEDFVFGIAFVVAGEDVELGSDLAGGIDGEAVEHLALQEVAAPLPVVVGTQAEVLAIVAGGELHVLFHATEGVGQDCGVEHVGVEVGIGTDEELLVGFEGEAGAIEEVVVHLDTAEAFAIEYGEVGTEHVVDVVLGIDTEVGGLAEAVEVVEGLGYIAVTPVALGEGALYGGYDTSHDGESVAVVLGEGVLDKDALDVEAVALLCVEDDGGAPCGGELIFVAEVCALHLEAVDAPAFGCGGGSDMLEEGYDGFAMRLEAMMMAVAFIAAVVLGHTMMTFFATIMMRHAVMLFLAAFVALSAALVLRIAGNLTFVHVVVRAVGGGSELLSVGCLLLAVGCLLLAVGLSLGFLGLGSGSFFSTGLGVLSHGGGADDAEGCHGQGGEDFLHDYFVFVFFICMRYVRIIACGLAKRQPYFRHRRRFVRCGSLPCRRGW